MIEIEKTHKIAFTEEQLRGLYSILDRNVDDLRATDLNPIYYELKDIYNPTAF
jgi:hypothetical protein